MANVFDFLKTKASLSRNAFDLSQRHVFSSRAGLIQPVFCIDTLPGDYFEVDLLSLTRTMPANTDAFARMKQEFSFVFVPYMQMWRAWDDFILQNKEQFSDEDGTNRESLAPCIPLTCILSQVLSNHKSYVDNNQSPDNADMFGYERAQFALRNLDMLGYGAYYWVIDSFDEAVKAGSTTQVAYNAVMTEIKAQFGNPYSDGDYESSVKVNLWRMLAYQKACNDYYRNQYYTSSNASLFNVDSWKASTLEADMQDHENQVWDIISTPWYRMYKKDMFTGLMPSPQFGAVSSVDMSNIQIVNVQNSTDSNRNTAGALVNGYGQGGALRSQGVTGSSNDTQWNIANAIDVYSLRKAEVMQKWKEDRLRAGNKNKNISDVIFGERSRYVMEKYSDFVKSFDGNLSFDEVVNSSAQGDVALGEVAGKVVGACSGKFTYKTSDFGVLICLYSVVPTSEYDALGLDKNNTLVEPFDYFEPHFENLGFDAVYQYQLNNSSTWTVGKLSDTIGFAPRYLNYKTAIDKVHGRFMRTGFGNDRDRSGDLSEWVTPRVDLEAALNTGGIAQPYFYVDPSIMNPTFAPQIDFEHNDIFQDQFYVNSNFVVNAVRNLSVLGLPRW